MSTPCQSMIDAAPGPWTRATRHPFLDGCRDGTLQPAQFDTWLVQDYFFVVGFCRLSGAVLRDAPTPHLDALLGGCGALQEELTWFRAKMAERGVDPDSEAQPACTRYIEYMDSLHQGPYVALAVAHWAIERVYHAAWSGILPAADPYAEFAQRWGNDGFGQYAAALERQTNEALSRAAPPDRALGEVVFARILEEEAAFWQMAFAGGAPG